MARISPSYHCHPCRLYSSVCKAWCTALLCKCCHVAPCLLWSAGTHFLSWPVSWSSPGHAGGRQSKLDHKHFSTNSSTINCSETSVIFCGHVRTPCFCHDRRGDRGWCRLQLTVCLIMEKSLYQDEQCFILGLDHIFKSFGWPLALVAGRARSIRLPGNGAKAQESRRSAGRHMEGVSKGATSHPTLCSNPSNMALHYLISFQRKYLILRY